MIVGLFALGKDEEAWKMALRGNTVSEFSSLRKMLLLYEVHCSVIHCCFGGKCRLIIAAYDSKTFN